MLDVSSASGETCRCPQFSGDALLNAGSLPAAPVWERGEDFGVRISGWQAIRFTGGIFCQFKTEWKYLALCGKDLRAVAVLETRLKSKLKRGKRPPESFQGARI